MDFRKEVRQSFEELLAACDPSTKGLEIFQAIDPDSVSPSATDNIPDSIQSILDEGRKLANQGRYADARREYESARREAEGQCFTEAAMESRLALVEIDLLEQRDVAAARDSLLDCLRDLSSTDTHARNRQVALGLLGDAEILLGRIEEGKSLYREALQLARNRNSRSSEAHYLVGLSRADELLGNLRNAHSHLDEAMELYRAEHRQATGEEAGRTAINLGACFSTRASLFRHQGKLIETIACLARAEPFFREANSLDNLGRTLLSRAEILFHEANREEGFEALKEALSTFESIGNVRWQCRCLDALAKVFFGDRKAASALACLERALELIGSERPELEAVPFLLKSADLCRLHDQKAAACDFIAKAKAP